MEPPKNSEKSQESLNKLFANQKKPLAYRDIASKVITILGILANISTISGLTIKGDFNPNLHPQKAPEVAQLKSQLLKVQSDGYSLAESAKLEEQLAFAFKETQHFSSLTKQEFNQKKHMLFVDNVTSTLNQEQHSSQQVDVENLLEDLDIQSRDLQEMERRFQASLEAKVFLDSDDKLDALAVEAGSIALVEYPVNSHDGIQDFYGNINDCLFTIYHCLVMGKPDLLNEVLDEERITLAPQIPAAYIKAFQFIRDQKVPNAMSNEAAIEINLYFDDLIDRLSRIM